MQSTETPALALDSADLSLEAYRALREGKEAHKETTAPVSPVEETPAADADNAEADAALEGEETESIEDSKQDSKPKKDKLTARFSELTGQIKALKSELAATMRGAGRSENAETTPADAPTLPPDPKDPEPDASKFGDYTEWQKSWMKWQIRQEKRQDAAARVHTERANAAKAVSDTFQSRISEAKSEYADFESVAFNKDLPVTAAMGDAIKESELGPKVLYHLGKHPDEAARIAQLSPVAQVREIGKLEAKLEADSAAANDTSEDPPTKKPAVSKAPPPIKPLGSGASSSSKPNLETMTMGEYRALRESGRIR